MHTSLLPSQTPVLTTLCRFTLLSVVLLRKSGAASSPVSLLSTALHVELGTSMDTSSSVIEVERFVSRKGTHAMIWLDNGTNFNGAEKELRERFEK